jgi:hypothetical protein
VGCDKNGLALVVQAGSSSFDKIHDWPLLVYDVLSFCDEIYHWPVLVHDN